MVTGVVPHGGTLALWLGWIALLILLVVHIVLRRDIRWSWKILWLLVIFLVPFVGVVGYSLVWAITRIRRSPTKA
jgi:hypothetical protein